MRIEYCNLYTLNRYKDAAGLLEEILKNGSDVLKLNPHTKT